MTNPQKKGAIPAAPSKTQGLEDACVAMAKRLDSEGMLEKTTWYAAWKERKIRMLGNDEVVEVFGWYWHCEQLPSGRVQATRHLSSKIRFQVEGDSPDDLWLMIGMVTMQWEPLEQKK